MHRFLIGLYSLFALSGTISTVDQVRKEFARSENPRLQLAAEALGDDRLLQLLNELRKEAPLTPKSDGSGDPVRTK